MKTLNKFLILKKKKSRNENSEQPSEQTSEQNNDNCPKWKRYRKYRNENSEQVSDNDNCPKWKKFKKFRNERSEANGENVEMKGGRGRRGQRKWDKFRTNENSESDSIEEKNAEEIKKEIGSLKEEMQLLMEKKRDYGEN